MKDGHSNGLKLGTASQNGWIEVGGGIRRGQPHEEHTALLQWKSIQISVCMHPACHVDDSGLTHGFQETTIIQCVVGDYFDLLQL